MCDNVSVLLVMLVTVAVSVAVDVFFAAVTVTMSTSAMAVTVSTAATSVTVAVLVEENEADQVDPEAGATNDEDELWIFDFLRREKFLKNEEKFNHFLGNTITVNCILWICHNNKFCTYPSTLITYFLVFKRILIVKIQGKHVLTFNASTRIEKQRATRKTALERAPRTSALANP